MMKTYETYEQLIDCYKQELSSAMINSDGSWRAVNPATIAIIRDVHAKYLELQKTLFPRESGEDFEHLYVNGKDILND